MSVDITKLIEKKKELEELLYIDRAKLTKLYTELINMCIHHTTETEHKGSYA